MSSQLDCRSSDPVKQGTEPILFSVGPVEMDPDIRRLGGEPLPYFRTPEFSEINRRIAAHLKQMTYAPADARVALLTASGTGAMEAAVINTFGEQDKILVVVGGTFGRRFADICAIHGLAHTILPLQQGQALRERDLEPYLGQGYSGLLVNAHETSTGVLHDVAMIGRVCRRANWILVVDAISSFLADPYRMEDWNVGVTILSTQKGLALPPGLSMLVVRQDIAARMRALPVRSLYFKLGVYFDDMERGQTPFTPAVGLLLQLQARLEQIAQQGVERSVEHAALLAQDFRRRVASLPFTIPSERLSNAVTPLQPREKISAYEVYMHLKDVYRLVVCPNGGELRDRLFRVGHLGHLSVADNTKLIDALSRMQTGGLI